MKRTLITMLMSLTLAAPAWADTVKIDEPWARATAPGQKVAGGFMNLTADADMTLVGGESPVSKTLELHIMRMDKGVMEMRQVQEIALPKGKTVSLAPGGLHIMFIDLQKQLKPGDKVPVTLVVKGADGKTQKLAVQADVMKAGGMGRHH